MLYPSQVSRVESSEGTKESSLGEEPQPRYGTIMLNPI